MIPSIRWLPLLLWCYLLATVAVGNDGVGDDPLKDNSVCSLYFSSSAALATPCSQTEPCHLLLSDTLTKNCAGASVVQLWFRPGTYNYTSHSAEPREFSDLQLSVGLWKPSVEDDVLAEGRVVVSLGGNGRWFGCRNCTVRIYDITVRDGVWKNATITTDPFPLLRGGGCLRVVSSMLDLRRSHFLNCLANPNELSDPEDVGGGAVLALNSIIRLSNCVFRHNTAGYGGALASYWNIDVGLANGATPASQLIDTPLPRMRSWDTGLGGSKHARYAKDGQWQADAWEMRGQSAAVDDSGWKDRWGSAQQSEAAGEQGSLDGASVGAGGSEKIGHRAEADVHANSLYFLQALYEIADQIVRFPTFFGSTSGWLSEVVPLTMTYSSVFQHNVAKSTIVAFGGALFHGTYTGSPGNLFTFTNQSAMMNTPWLCDQACLTHFLHRVSTPSVEGDSMKFFDNSAVLQSAGYKLGYGGAVAVVDSSPKVPSPNDYPMTVSFTKSKFVRNSVYSLSFGNSVPRPSGETPLPDAAPSFQAIAEERARFAQSPPTTRSTTPGFAQGDPRSYAHARTVMQRDFDQPFGYPLQVVEHDDDEEEEWQWANAVHQGSYSGDFEEMDGGHHAAGQRIRTYVEDYENMYANASEAEVAPPYTRSPVVTLPSQDSRTQRVRSNWLETLSSDASPPPPPQPHNHPSFPQDDAPMRKVAARLQRAGVRGSSAQLLRRMSLHGDSTYDELSGADASGHNDMPPPSDAAVDEWPDNVWRDNVVQHHNEVGDDRRTRNNLGDDPNYTCPPESLVCLPFNSDHYPHVGGGAFSAITLRVQHHFRIKFSACNFTANLLRINSRKGNLIGGDIMFFAGWSARTNYMINATVDILDSTFTDTKIEGHSSIIGGSIGIFTDLLVLGNLSHNVFLTSHNNRFEGIKVVMDMQPAEGNSALNGLIAGWVFDLYIQGRLGTVRDTVVELSNCTFVDNELSVFQRSGSAALGWNVRLTGMVSLVYDVQGGSRHESKFNKIFMTFNQVMRNRVTMKLLTSPIGFREYGKMLYTSVSHPAINNTVKLSYNDVEDNSMRTQYVPGEDPMPVSQSYGAVLLSFGPGETRHNTIIVEHCYFSKNLLVGPSEVTGAALTVEIEGAAKASSKGSVTNNAFGNSIIVADSMMRENTLVVDPQMQGSSVFGGAAGMLVEMTCSNNLHCQLYDNHVLLRTVGVYNNVVFVAGQDVDSVLSAGAGIMVALSQEVENDVVTRPAFTRSELYLRGCSLYGNSAYALFGSGVIKVVGGGMYMFVKQVLDGFASLYFALHSQGNLASAYSQGLEFADEALVAGGALCIRNVNSAILSIPKPELGENDAVLQYPKVQMTVFTSTISANQVSTHQAADSGLAAGGGLFVSSGGVLINGYFYKSHFDRNTIRSTAITYPPLAYGGAVFLRFGGGSLYSAQYPNVYPVHLSTFVPPLMHGAQIQFYLCNVLSNSAHPDQISALGGGMYAQLSQQSSATFTVASTDFQDNIAAAGGALYVRGANCTNCTLYMEHSSFRKNTAAIDAGGALRVQTVSDINSPTQRTYNTYSGMQVVLQNCLLVGNRAEGRGAGIALDRSNGSLYQTKLFENVAIGVGGALLVEHNSNCSLEGGSSAGFNEASRGQFAWVGADAHISSESDVLITLDDRSNAVDFFNPHSVVGLDFSTMFCPRGAPLTLTDQRASGPEGLACLPCPDGSYDIGYPMADGRRLEDFRRCHPCSAALGVLCFGRSSVFIANEYQGFRHNSVAQITVHLCHHGMGCPNASCPFTASCNVGRDWEVPFCGGCLPGHTEAFLTPQCIPKEECQSGKDMAFITVVLAGVGLLVMGLFMSNAHYHRTRLAPGVKASYWSWFGRAVRIGMSERKQAEKAGLANAVVRTRTSSQGTHGASPDKGTRVTSDAKGAGPRRTYTEEQLLRTPTRARTFSDGRHDEAERILGEDAGWYSRTSQCCGHLIRKWHHSDWADGKVGRGRVSRRRTRSFSLLLKPFVYFMQMVSLFWLGDGVDVSVFALLGFKIGERSTDLRICPFEMTADAELFFQGYLLPLFALAWWLLIFLGALLAVKMCPAEDMGEGAAAAENPVVLSDRMMVERGADDEDESVSDPPSGFIHSTDLNWSWYDRQRSHGPYGEGANDKRPAFSPSTSSVSANALMGSSLKQQLLDEPESDSDAYLALARPPPHPPRPANVLSPSGGNSELPLEDGLVADADHKSDDPVLAGAGAADGWNVNQRPSWTESFRRKLRRQLMKAMEFWGGQYDIFINAWIALITISLYAYSLFLQSTFALLDCREFPRYETALLPDGDMSITKSNDNVIFRAGSVSCYGESSYQVLALIFIGPLMLFPFAVWWRAWPSRRLLWKIARIERSFAFEKKARRKITDRKKLERLQRLRLAADSLNHAEEEDSKMVSRDSSRSLRMSSDSASTFESFSVGLDSVNMNTTPFPLSSVGREEDQQISARRREHREHVLKKYQLPKELVKRPFTFWQLLRLAECEYLTWYFKPKYWFWETVLMTRRLVAVFLFTFVQNGRLPWRSVALCFWCLFSFLWHLVARPYDSVFANFGEAYMLGVLVCVSIMDAIRTSITLVSGPKGSVQPDDSQLDFGLDFSSISTINRIMVGSVLLLVLFSVISDLTWYCKNRRRGNQDAPRERTNLPPGFNPVINASGDVYYAME